MKEGGGFDFNGYEGTHQSLSATNQVPSTSNNVTAAGNLHDMPNLNNVQDPLENNLPAPGVSALVSQQSPCPGSNEGSATTTSLSEHSMSMSPLSSLRRKTPDLSALGLGFTANMHGVTPRRGQDNAECLESMRSPERAQRNEKVSRRGSASNSSRKSPKRSSHARGHSQILSTERGRQGITTASDGTIDLVPSYRIPLNTQSSPQFLVPGSSVDNSLKKETEGDRPDNFRQSSNQHTQSWSLQPGQPLNSSYGTSAPIDRFMEHTPLGNVMMDRTHPPQARPHSMYTQPEAPSQIEPSYPNSSASMPGPWMDVYNSPQLNQGFSMMLSGYSLSGQSHAPLDPRRANMPANTYGLRDNREPVQWSNGMPLPPTQVLPSSSKSGHSPMLPEAQDPPASRQYMPELGQWDTGMRSRRHDQMPSQGPPSSGSVPTLGRPSRRASRTHRRNNTSRTIEGISTSTAPLMNLPTAPKESDDPFAGPVVNERPPGGYYWGLSIDPERGDTDLGDSTDGNDDILPIQLYEPPLHNCVPVYPQALEADQQLRPRKKSKYTPEQDQVILDLKNAGQGWAEIAQKAGCDNHLAARNRYQVLIGQQGGSTFFWTTEDCSALQSLLDEGERAKWIHIAQELSKKQSRTFTMEQCHYKISEMFAQSPETFGVVKSRDPNQGGAPYKRKPL